MRKLALHIGPSTFEPAPYRGDPPTELPAAASDARRLAALTRTAGFVSLTIVGDGATRRAVIDAFADLRDNLEAGDLLVVTFSGHGALHSDAARWKPAARPVGADNRYPRDEPGAFDQSWCLRDGVLIDDALHDHLVELRAGVRIHVLSDSCYSGDILRAPLLPPAMSVAEARPCAATDAAIEVDELLRDGASLDGAERRRARRPAITASVLLSAAATAEGQAGGTEGHGLFTEAVVSIWGGGSFTGDHHDFQRALQATLRGQAVPPLKVYGADDRVFALTRPFGAAGPARKPSAAQR